MSSFSPTRFESGRPMLLAGLRQHHQFATVAPSDLAGQWERFSSLGAIPGRVGSNSYGVMCGADTTGFEYMCAVEVASFDGFREGMGRMRVPAQRYAVFVHPGEASTLRATWMQILKWLESGDYASAHTPDFELYGSQYDPMAAGGSGIEIWVGVVPRS